MDHLFVVGAAAPANGEHAGGLAHAHALLSRQLPVQETRQRRKKRNLLYMRFPVQHGLIQVGNTPALGNIEAKQGSQLFRGLFRHGISPGPELRQLVSLCVKGQIAVHHTGNANGPHLPDGLAEALLNLPLQVRVTGPESLIDLVHGIGPDPIDQLVFPGKAAGSQRPEISVHQHCLDSGRTQFNTEDRILQLHMFPLSAQLPGDVLQHQLLFQLLLGGVLVDMDILDTHNRRPNPASARQSRHSSEPYGGHRLR